MKITEYKKKNGTIVYRSSVYLGVDKLTGKKARTTVTAKTKTGVKIKLERPLMLLQTMDIVLRKNQPLLLIRN